MDKAAAVHRSERQQTDQSLRAERERSDRAIAKQQAEASADADAVIEHARETADAVLDTARDKADEQFAAQGAPPATLTSMARERATEDETVRRERSEADEAVERERADARLALLKLLPLERTKTDRFLLTERVRSDDAVSNRDNFLGIVSHDLRNLLGAIVTSAEIMARAGDSAHDHRSVLAGVARIRGYAARMNRLVGDLLDVTAIDAGELTVKPCDLDIGDVIAETLQMFQTEAVSRGIALERRGNSWPLMASFDRDRILQLLANLVSNALKFTERDGHVSIAADCSDGKVRVSVTDTGPGIPVSMQTVVFERFWQADEHDRRGHGLGLYISKSIVQAHGGSIWIESGAGGTAMVFTLPQAG